jgi:dTDP-4-dehydrorhamnose 3,5-epimerase
MIVKFLKTNLKGLLLIKRPKYSDNRGYLTEVLNTKEFFNSKINLNNTLITESKKNVLRGFHYQKKKPLNQLVTCIKGAILDVVVDIRKESKTFGKYESFVLSEKNNLSFFMNEGFAHAFLTLIDNSVLIYNYKGNYIKKYDSGFIWNDLFINFKWGIKRPILSDKDKNLKDFCTEFNL